LEYQPRIWYYFTAIVCDKGSMPMRRTAACWLANNGLDTKGEAMPLVTLTVRKPTSSAFKAMVLDTVHAALVSSGVPATDRFQRVIELEADDFRYGPSYPDLKSEHQRFMHARA
jgi:hypothetical protein